MGSIGVTGFKTKFPIRKSFERESFNFENWFVWNEILCKCFLALKSIGQYSTVWVLFFKMSFKHRKMEKKKFKFMFSWVRDTHMMMKHAVRKIVTAFQAKRVIQFKMIIKKLIKCVLYNMMRAFWIQSIIGIPANLYVI